MSMMFVLASQGTTVFAQPTITGLTTAVLQGESGISVQWDAEPLADSYNVYREVDNTGGYVFHVNVFNESIIDTIFLSGLHTYCYAVKGVNSGGESKLFSNVSCESVTGLQ